MRTAVGRLLLVTALLSLAGTDARGQVAAYPATPEGTSLCAYGQSSALGGETIFAAYDAEHGCELWKSDGTVAGTSLLKDLYPLIGNGYPGGFKPALGRVLFLANGTSNGTALWITDGTEAGTTPLAEFAPIPIYGAVGINFIDPSQYGLQFFSTESLNGADLWATDGTPAGTFFLATSYGPTPTILPQGIFFYHCDSATTGCEPWISDGTPAGTHLLADINPGTANSNYGTQFISAAGKVFFQACDPVSGCEPWVSDGTAAGTVLLKDVRTGSAGSNPVSFFDTGSRAVFFADDGVSGREVWASDGTPSGTARIADIYAGANSGALSSISGLGSRLLFLANDGTTGTEPWVTDGTAGGTARLADTSPGSVSWVSSVSVGGRVVLAVVTSVTGSSIADMWGTDGTPGGTALLQAGFTMLDGGPFARKAYLGGGSRLIFWGGVASVGSEPWVTDGTPAGTLSLDIYSGPQSSGPSQYDSYYSNNRSFVVAGPDAYFSANDGAHGYELWRSDGTLAGTAMVADVYPGVGSSNPSGATVVDSTLFFLGSDGVNQGTLFISDGTPSGTSPLVSNAGAQSLLTAGDSIFFNVGMTVPPYTTRIYTVGDLVAGCLPVPRDDCKDAMAGGKATLQLKDGVPDKNDQVQFKAVIGEASSKTDFGTPASTTGYRLCLYDDGQVLMSAGADAGSAWSEGATGFKFKGGTTSELSQVVLKAGSLPGQPKVQAKGKGDALVMPALGGIVGPVVAQLVPEEGDACWSATFPAPFRKNTIAELNARSQ